MKRDFYRAGVFMFSWLIIVGPALAWTGYHFWSVPGAIVGAILALVGYIRRYWVYITKMKLVWEEERITRERISSEIA